MKHTYLLAVLALFWAANATAAALSVRLIAQEGIPPKWIGHNGKLTGLCPDIIAAIEKVEPGLRIDPRIVSRSVPVIEHSLEIGSVDGACALLDTPRRRQIAQIVGPPVYTVRHRIAGNSGDTAVVSSLDDLIKLNSLVTTSRGSGYVDQLLALGLQVDATSGDNAVNLRKVVAGHGRFMYLNEMTLNWYIREEKLQDKLKLWPAVFKEEPIYFWISKKAKPETHELIGRALDKLHKNGTLANIYQRWSGK
jgi:polar amino acid transport system substrate-binding protein